MKNLLTIALIPAYNESAHISRVVSGAAEYLHTTVIDDGSIDNTFNLAQQAGAEVLAQVPNQGKGAALKMGFRHALTMGCDAVIMLDADGQHDPHEIPLFIEAYEKRKSDLIIGSRDFSKMPIIRRSSNTIGRYLLSWAMGQYIEDNQSGYRLLSRRMIEAVLESKEGGFEFEVDMVIICLNLGYQLDWVPISTIYADEKSHISPLHLAVNYLRLVYQARRRRRKKSR